MTIYFPNETQPEPGTFCAFMHAEIGRNWVVARRTSRIVAKYGEGVVCLSPAKYDALKRRWDATKPDPKRDATKYTREAMQMARKYIERLPIGHNPGQRSGPEERNVHAALVVAIRLGDESGLFSHA